MAWICGGSKPKLPPLTIPRRRRPAAGSFSELQSESSIPVAMAVRLVVSLRAMMASCPPPRCRMLLRGGEPATAAGLVTAALIVQVALLLLIHLSNM
jgi:hypothetical protein